MRTLDKTLAGFVTFVTAFLLYSGLFPLSDHEEPTPPEPFVCHADIDNAQAEQTMQAYFYDDADVLSETEFDALWEQIQDTAEETDMHIGIFLSGSALTRAETVTFCDDAYDQLFGPNTDGLYLYLDFSGQSNLYDYISTSGLGQFYYTNSEENNRIQAIFDQMNPYLQRGEEDVPAAVTQFLGEVEEYAEMGAPSDTYYVYNSDTDLYTILEDDELIEVETLPRGYADSSEVRVIWIAAIVIGLLTGLGIFFGIRKRYQFKQPGEMGHYLQQDSVRYTVRTDRFLRRHRTRHRIQTDHNTGGGGGSSHTSFSGGSHGGGGNSR